jgi:nucleoside-diphosphate-sugar epimerase
MWKERRMFSRHLSQGVEKVIHFSAVDVYGTGEGDITEETPLQYTDKEYGDSKVDVELICRKYFERGLSVIVLRPAIVYVPYCKLWSVKFAERLFLGKWAVIKGFAEGTCNLVYIGNLD